MNTEVKVGRVSLERHRKFVPFARLTCYFITLFNGRCRYIAVHCGAAGINTKLTTPRFGNGTHLGSCGSEVFKGYFICLILYQIFKFGSHKETVSIIFNRFFTIIIGIGFIGVVGNRSPTVSLGSCAVKGSRTACVIKSPSGGIVIGGIWICTGSRVGVGSVFFLGNGDVIYPNINMHLAQIHIETE